MKRLIDWQLTTWKNAPQRKPLLLKEALAEIDYLYDCEGKVLPIEVKSGHGSTLRSMHQFLEEHPKSPLGLRFWSENYASMHKIDSRPLYAIATLAHSDQKEALLSLM